MLILAAILTALIALGTALPFLPLAHGIVRVGDFPRQQMLVVAVALLAVSIFWSDGDAAWSLIQLVLFATVLTQVFLIAEFTPFWRKQSKGYDPATDVGERIRLCASNVKMSNTRHGELAAEIARHDPDIVILMEIDAKWVAGLSGLLERYPHVVDQSQENSYGMVLASRLPLSDVSVQCLLTDGVPSIIATARTPEGRRFRIYSIHPEPPVPTETTEGRDGETSLVALKVREEKLPVIVTGDLNDVAWSKTTRRFRRISGLLDPRVGREIFSTFDARIPLIRWPLDHLFHSADFRLAGMKRLAPSGSDHFPVLFDLVLCSDAKSESEPDAAEADDIKRAGELVEAAAKRDDEPIGTDWER